MSGRVRTMVMAYGLMIPAALLVAGLLIFPLYIVLKLSFCDGNPMSLDQIGTQGFSLTHYTKVFSSANTIYSVTRSVIYAVGSLIPSFLIGLGTALLLNRSFPGRRAFRTLVLIPWSVPGVVASVSFLWLLNGAYGVVNYLLRSVGLISKNIDWFTNPSTAMAAVIIPTIWKGYPFFTLMLLAALQSIPIELYEAAKVDGASKVAQFRYITWPGIRNTATLALVLQGLWTFRVFDIIYSTTGGGPLRVTETLALRIYNEAFGFFRTGMASALGVLTLAICALIVLLSYRALRQRFY